MKKMLIISCLSVFLVGASAKIYAAGNAGSTIIYNGTVISTYFTQDSNSVCHVWGTVGSISADPTTWASQDMSISGVSSPTITQPILTIDPSTGNAICTWEYYDPSLNIMRVAAAVLPAGSSTWTSPSQVISDVTTESSGSGDQSVSIDASGDIIVTWSAYNKTSQISVIRAVTATLTDGVAYWNSSFTMPEAGYPGLAENTVAPISDVQPALPAKKVETKPAAPQPKTENVRMPAKSRNN